MKVNVKKTRRITLLIGLVMILSVVLAACVDTTSVPDILDESRIQETSSTVVEVSDDEISTPEGYTEAPVISGAVNIVLNLFFVTQCGMDVDGVALASIISLYLSAALILISLFTES